MVDYGFFYLLLLIGLVLVVVGLAFKISAAPFHMWTPDVYEGVPTPVTAYFAVVPKLAVAVLLARILTGAFANFVGEWQNIIIILSALSMTIGAFAGVWQRNLKRLIAYSSIANMGYALIGLAAFAQNGISAMLVFFTIYMLVSVGIFAVIMSIQVRQKKVEAGIEQIEHLNGLAKSNPFLAALLGLMMLSMIGLPFPPFAGFFGKFFIFKAAMDAGLFGLAVLGVVSSVVAAFYYLRIVKVMYFDSLADDVKVVVHLSRATKAVLVIMIIVNAVIFFQPHKLLDEIPAVKLQINNKI
jgi:NADH-quinone oxidoreductase subunit N